ncbi:Uncharacterised protein [Escherichia coli]|uniref:Uncharacterized protein n=1 Tax=Escherichia coli TaxID=562 RepID=A0A2X3KMR3_ECOLX|nr:Uncharacterised protein [Escherichia coli]
MAFMIAGNGKLCQRDLRHLFAIAHDNHPIGIATSSSSSEEITSSARPSRISVSIRRMISAWAPTSMPRLAHRGSEIAVGSVANVKATLFADCRPERNSIGCSVEGVRMPSWRIKRSAISCCSLREMGRSQPRWAWRARMIFSRTGGGGDDAIGFPVFRAESDAQY